MSIIAVIGGTCGFIKYYVDSLSYQFTSTLRLMRKPWTNPLLAKTLLTKSPDKSVNANLMVPRSDLEEKLNEIYESASVQYTVILGEKGNGKSSLVYNFFLGKPGNFFGYFIHNIIFTLLPFFRHCVPESRPINETRKVLGQAIGGHWL